MKKNVGSIDKIIRLLLAAIFIILFFTNVVVGIFGYILLALAAILILTSVFSFCPIFMLFGINTCKTK
jgi:hypothetical protein